MNGMSKFSSITIPVLEERLRRIAMSPQRIVSPLPHEKAIQETSEGSGKSMGVVKDDEEI
jgi:hypothetical protein